MKKRKNLIFPLFDLIIALIEVIRSPFLEKRIRKSGLVCQTKSDRMMLWQKLVGQKWRGISLSCSLFFRLPRATLLK